jgi:hypothetical protein
MTYRAYHEPSNMPALVPGVPTALAQEDRLRLEGRLRQQPAGDSTKENRSRAIKTKLPNGCLAESRLAPTGATEAKDGVTTTTTASTNQRLKTLPHDGIRGKREGIYLPDADPGKGAL